MVDDILRWLFHTNNLTPHGFCLAASPGIIWLHAIADTLVGLTYFSIPFILISFLMKRRDVLFRPVIGLFAAFILLCGTGHFLAVLTLWVPAYGIEGTVKVATATVSIATAIALWKLLPQALALPTPAQHRQLGSALSELQQAEERLVSALVETSAARDTAERANRTMKEFVANISHEIRTPMSEVMGLSYLLGKCALDARQADLLSKIERSTHSLLAIINNVLDLSKIEAGEIVMDDHAFDLNELVKMVSETAASRAADKGVAFDLDLQADLPAMLHGDSTRMTQILSNLLGNAVKFTDAGQVKFIVKGATTPTGAVALSFIIQDTGIGFDGDVRDRLFSPFVQADMSITRRFGGTGLGLSIVKRLTDMMGGRLECSSVVGVGSEFAVHLTMMPAPAEAIEPRVIGSELTGQHALAGMCILVVDDSDIVQDVTKRSLELEGATVVVAGNGQEAVDRLRDDADGIQVVLMDIQMPVLDGYDATRSIRVELGLTALPIIGLTASALSSQRQRAFDVGMNDFVSKPFTLRTLLEAILRHARIAADPTGPHRASAHEPSTTWPEFEGVDSGVLREQIDGDTRLFLKLLNRLGDEFADLTVGPEPAGAESFEHCRERLHKLKGASGTLGARRIHDIADRAEQACAERDAARAGPLMRELADHLGRLRAAIAERTAMPPGPADDVVRPMGPVEEPAGLGQLVTLLRRQSMLAVHQFESMKSSLRTLAGTEAVTVIEDHIDSLRFTMAADLLERYRT